MEKSTAPVTISSSYIEQQLERLRNKPIISPKTRSEPVLLPQNPYLEAAAVLIFFDLDTLRPVFDLAAAERQEAIRQLIGMSEVAIGLPKNDHLSLNIPANTDSQMLFYLRDEVRTRTLSVLIEQNRLAEAVVANKPVPTYQADLLQQTLTDCLSNRVPLPLTDLTLEQLTALQRVSAWLDGTGLLSELPTPDQISNQLATVEMLRPFRHLTGRYEQGKFREYFRGRQAELTTLRSYVGVAPAQGTLESIQRWYRNHIDAVLSLQKRPPLLIYGLGGVGKSSLIAKFILEHAEAHQQKRFPFVYLDFDRTGLSAIDPETLLIEAARQLAVQYADHPAISTGFRRYGDTWKQQLILFSNTSTVSTILKFDNDAQQTRQRRDNMLTEFMVLAGSLSQFEPRPFLLVLDTFEEVQYKGREYVDELYKFLTEFQSHYPQLRTVLAGRAIIPEFETQVVQLGDLDAEAAQGCLLKMGISDTQTAQMVARKIGGNPLSLKLAAELVKSIGVVEFKKVHLSEKQFLFVEERFPERAIQGILYERILDHIHSKNSRKLAYPGLVLRQITPDLIQKVLAEPCQLIVPSPVEARRLFNALSSEVSLVTLTDANTLRHRPDVRKVMLKLTTQSQPLLVADIHRRAADYYASRSILADRAEGFYHLLALNTTREVLEQQWLDGFQNFLLNSLDELPTPAQAYLLARTGTDHPDPAFWDTVDEADLERWLTHRTADLLNAGLAEHVISLLDRYRDRIDNPTLSLFRAKALSQLGRFEDSKQTAEDALKNQEPQPLSEHVLEELNVYQKTGRQHVSEEESDSYFSSPSAETSPTPPASDLPGMINYEV